MIIKKRFSVSRGGTKVKPPFFIRKCNCNNNEIHMDGSYIFCNYEVIIPHSVPYFRHTFANTEHDDVHQRCKVASGSMRVEAEAKSEPL
jgi:hypothetical protein